MNFYRAAGCFLKEVRPKSQMNETFIRNIEQPDKETPKNSCIMKSSLQDIK